MSGVAVTAVAQESKTSDLTAQPGLSIAVAADPCPDQGASGSNSASGSSGSRPSCTAFLDSSNAQFHPASVAHARSRGINWSGVLSQSLLYVSVQHIARFSGTRTREKLGGPFVSDWFDSIGSMDRFNDNGKILTNWIAHPMMGSTSAFILGQNDPEYATTSVGSGDRYWRTKGKQLLFATAYSAQFELGPLSESSLGNIHQGGIDLVLTPTLGDTLVGQRGPDGAAHPPAFASAASDRGQRAGPLSQSDEKPGQRDGVQATVGVRRSELPVTQTDAVA